MFDEILRNANDLLNKGDAFALAVVVRREAPISGKTGDKAIIQADGTIAGWIGGGCTQPVVIKEAQNAIRDGKPRFVRVTPNSSKDPLQGILEYNMTCHSGGTIDVYIEPILPKTHLIIIGQSPVGQILAKLAKVLDYRISVFAPNAEKALFPDADSIHDTFDLTEPFHNRQTFVVVATQGQDDEGALEAALKTQPGYVAFVASRKKAEAVFSYLKGRGLSEKQLEIVKVPAGLDIKANLPNEIAVSILAEIIQVRNTQEAELPAPAQEQPQNIEEAIDPVCGMSVKIEAAKHKSAYDGQTYYFCCPGCKAAFEQSPQEYLGNEQNLGYTPVKPVKA